MLSEKSWEVRDPQDLFLSKPRGKEKSEYPNYSTQFTRVNSEVLTIEDLTVRTEEEDALLISWDAGSLTLFHQQKGEEEERDLLYTENASKLVDWSKIGKE